MAIQQKKLSNGKVLYDVYVQAWNIHGKRVQKRKRGLPNMKLARECEANFRAELMLERKQAPRLSWDAWLAVCIEQMRVTLRPTTVENYGGQLAKWVTPHFGPLEINTITPQDVHDVIHVRMQAVSPNTRRSVLKMVARIFTMAVQNGRLTVNPALPIKVQVPQPKQEALNESEVQKLLDCARHLEHRFYPIWAMALFAGMRSGELYALRWSDIDFESGRIQVTRSWCSKAGFGPTKTQRNRVVPLSDSSRRLLAELKLRCGAQEEGQDFVLPHLKEWSGGAQAMILRDFCKSIGVKSIKFHDLRATFITQLLLKGVPLAQVMAIVGHTQLKTTNCYLRVVGTDLRDAVDKLGYLFMPREDVGKVIELRPSSSPQKTHCEDDGFHKFLHIYSFLNRN